MLVKYLLMGAIQNKYDQNNNTFALFRLHTGTKIKYNYYSLSCMGSQRMDLLLFCLYQYSLYIYYIDLL